MKTKVWVGDGYSGRGMTTPLSEQELRMWAVEQSVLLPIHTDSMTRVLDRADLLLAYVKKEM